MVKKLVTLRGVVVPAEWDDKGEVIAIAIATHDEDEYLMDGKVDAEKHFDLLRREVEVRGWPREEAGRKIITSILKRDIQTELPRKSTSDIWKNFRVSSIEPKWLLRSCAPNTEDYLYGLRLGILAADNARLDHVLALRPPFLPRSRLSQTGCPAGGQSADIG